MRSIRPHPNRAVMRRSAMWHRGSAWVAVLGAVTLTAPGASVVLLGQTTTSAQGRSTTAPSLKTPWGHPDLQGIWTSNEMAGVPFERAKELGNREYFTEEEAAKRKVDGERLSRDERNDRGGQQGNEQGPTHWYEWFGRSSRRTSLIVDPRDGQFPPFTPAGEKMPVVLGSFAPGPWNGPEDFNTWDRCITRGLPSAMIPTAYNNGFQILQTPRDVVILHEMLHIVRVIPVDGRPHVHQGIRLWEGDARGRWEGNTLVVDVTNFTPKIKGTLPPNGLGEGFFGGKMYTGTGDGMRLVERWTRTAQDMLKYEATIEDPSIFTRPWTIVLDLRLENDYRIYEYACHEGNRAIENTLRGSRAEEKAAAGQR
jgi:hypothetical protein